MKEIYFKEEARNKLFNGIQILHNAVASTLGPNGKTVIITDEYGKPYVTKDGVSVARKQFSLKIHVENIGAQLLKQACRIKLLKKQEMELLLQLY
jgi:chaperonin GroEL